MERARDDKRVWRIGELAKAAGLTVRTLHHYEEAGLLAPVERTEGAHRLYDERSVERLYRIRALRGFGLSLAAIGQILTDGSTLATALRTHLEHVERELDRLTLLRDRLRTLTEAEADIGSAELLATLDAMARIERRAHTRQQKQSREASEAIARWRVLGPTLRECMQRGESPSSEPVRALAAEAQSLIEAFAGGDATLVADMARLRAVEPPRDLPGWELELMQYLDRALAALETERELSTRE
jgi:DNA-binding transcriptional MerR regulator